MIKGIIFDKDGTLFRYEEFWVPVAKGVAKSIASALKTESDITEELLDSIGADKGISGVLCKGTYEEIAECFLAVIKKHSLECEDILKLTIDSFHKCFDCGVIVPACENIASLFATLKAEGYKAFLVTSDDRYVTDICLDALGIKEYFDEVFSNNGEYPAKPNPFYINLISQKYGLALDELVMVGDTMTDMSFAKNAGICSVGVAVSESDREVIKPYATVVVKDISHIKEAINEIQAI